MSYEQLLEKIQRIREARVDARAAAKNKPVRKSREKKHDLEKIFDKMSEEDKIKLIASLGED